MRQALIVTGGTVETAFVRTYLWKMKPDFLIAVDSGMKFFYEAEIKPDMIVGDFDSVEPKILDYFEAQANIEWLRLVPEKDDTDTEAAIRQAIALGYTKIHILGGTGTRIDHMLGNIHLLGIGLQEKAEIFLVDANNRIRMINHGIKLKKEEQYGKYVSLLPFTPEVKGLTLKGMKYPLQEHTLMCFNSLGISNEIVEDIAEITFTEGVLLVVETKD